MESLRGDAIKYLSIELVKKDPKAQDADKIEAGLFKGIRELEYEVQGEVNAIVTQDFLLVVPSKEKEDKADLSDDKYMKAFSLDAYNVLSFTAFDGSVRHIIFMKCDEKDQADAMKIIRGLMLKLSEAGRIPGKDGIIDVSTYSDLPEDFNDAVRNCVGNLNRNAQAAAGYRAPGAVGTGVNNAYSSAAATQGANYYVKKPFFFKRATEKPKPTFIKEMSTLLDNLADDDYIDKPFQKVKNDTDDKVQPTDIPKAGTIGSETDYELSPWVGGCC